MYLNNTYILHIQPKPQVDLLISQSLKLSVNTIANPHTNAGGLQVSQPVVSNASGCPGEPGGSGIHSGQAQESRRSSDQGELSMWC